MCVCGVNTHTPLSPGSRSDEGRGVPCNPQLLDSIDTAGLTLQTQ